MPEELGERASETVRRLFHDEWDPTATFGFDPTLDPATSDDALPIHFGNYDSDLADPQVSITQPQGETTMGGERWSGKNADGGMNQFRRGQVLVQVWAETGTTYNGETPQDVLYAIRTEAERIIGAFEDGPDSGPNAGIIWSFSSAWNGRMAEEEADEPAPTWQSQVTVTYDWERQT